MKPRIFYFAAFPEGRRWHVQTPDGGCVIPGIWEDCLVWLQNNWGKVEEMRAWAEKERKKRMRTPVGSYTPKEFEALCSSPAQ